MNTKQTLQSLADSIPVPVLVALRGVGQVFFQENALTGALFVLGIALSSPLMAVGAVIGAIVGTAVARVLKFDQGEVQAGIYGFNATLVGIATLFFFELSVTSVVLMLAGCVVATAITRVVRRNVPFPTYTMPFIVTTWGIFFLGRALGLASAGSGYGPLVPEVSLGTFGDAITHGVSQVMFQASLWTAILFVAGIAVSDRQHAAWVVLGSLVGMLLAGYHVDAATRSLDPEQLVERVMFDNIQLGLYGYNATLVAVALFLWRRSVIPALLGVLFSVPLTELLPRFGLPALTAPFVLAAWLVILLGWLESRLFHDPAEPAA